MSRLQLSIAVGDYDRTRPLVDGRVSIDGVDPVGLQLVPEEMFFRAFRHEAFDVSELSFSSYCVKLAQGDCPDIVAMCAPQYRVQGIQGTDHDDSLRPLRKIVVCPLSQ